MSAKSVPGLLFLFAAFSLITASPEENVRSGAHNPVISHIPRDSVNSKAISSVGYSRRRHILEIEFANGAVYRYLQVAPSVYRDLMASDSKARYYDANIKGNYPSARVRSRANE
jgi:hypothetical protein